MSPVPPEAGRIEVKIRSARRREQKKDLRDPAQGGNLEWATNFPAAPTGDYAGETAKKLTVAQGWANELL